MMKRTLSLGLLMGLFSTACGTYDYPVNPNAGSGGVRTGDSIRFLGRVGQGASGTLLAWSGTGVVTAFTGKSIKVDMAATDKGMFNDIAVVLDGKVQDKPIHLQDGTTQYTVTADGDGTHDLQLIKRTEATEGTVMFKGFEPTSALAATPAPATKLIEMIGDSITAGFGVHGTGIKCDGPDNTNADPNMEDASVSYGAVAAQTLSADWSLVAVSGRGVATNYDGSPANNPKELTVPSLWKLIDPNDTTTAYDFKRQADVVVINLGTNDFSHYNFQMPPTLPPQAPFVTAYVKLVQDVRAQYKDAQIILALGPMLSDYSQPQLTTAQAYVKAAMGQLNDAKVSTIVFPANSTDVGCDYHPNVKSQAAMADSLVTQIKKVTAWQ